MLVSGRLSGVFCQAFAPCFVCFNSPWGSLDLSCNHTNATHPSFGSVWFRLCPFGNPQKSDGVWESFGSRNIISLVSVSGDGIFSVSLNVTEDFVSFNNDFKPEELRIAPCLWFPISDSSLPFAPAR